MAYIEIKEHTWSTAVMIAWDDESWPPTLIDTAYDNENQNQSKIPLWVTGDQN